jgi:DNA-binding transcriptional LysR family regulator
MIQSIDVEPLSPGQAAIEDQSLLSGQFWAELRVFLVVAKAKSFNRAAEILNTSQPTVSRQVKRLQDLMGSQLFVPSQHGVKLTPRGEDLANALTKLDRSLFALTNDLKGDTKQPEGIVRVSVVDALNVYFLAPALRQFASDYPKIQIHLKEPRTIRNLHESQVDVMIGFHPVESVEVFCRKLGNLHFVPIASRSYLSKYGLPRRQNLDKHLFLQLESYVARTDPWAQWNYITSRGCIAHVCDNALAYATLVKAGLGIGLLGSYAVLEPAAVPLEIDVQISLPLYAVALEERRKAKAVRVVLDWLSEMFGPANPWFAPVFRLDVEPGPYDAGFKSIFNPDQRPDG